MRYVMVILLSLFGIGCMKLPDGVYPVDDFDVNKYLGKWYEIARLDHSFERGLDNVSAHYTLRDDGGVRVLNRGYSVADKKWKEAEGKAYFIGSRDTGHLKVSFFGPFYGSYVVFELDKENYQYAFVTSSKTTYLWFLSRTPTVSKELVQRFVQKANDLGYNTDNLIFVKHK